MLRRVALLYILFSSNFVTPEDGPVYEYTAANFKQKIEDLEANFVMFYTTWCSFCNEFRPIWTELADMVNTKQSEFAIAQVDCMKNAKLCLDCDITGYPTLLYYHKNSFTPVEYKGTADLPSLTLFLSEAYGLRSEKAEEASDKVKLYAGMSYYNDHNIEKSVSDGQHFIMFFAPWCRASQTLAPIWAKLAVYYKKNDKIQIGKVNCLESEDTCKKFNIKFYPRLLWIANGKIVGATIEETLDDLKKFVNKMQLIENHEPELFAKKPEGLPITSISEETLETFLEVELVFINYYTSWCGHCARMTPVWRQLAERYRNESRVLIAHMDCMQYKTHCTSEKIDNFPTFIMYKNKKIVRREEGTRPFSRLVALVKLHLEQASTQDDIIQDSKILLQDSCSAVTTEQCDTLVLSNDDIQITSKNKDPKTTSLNEIEDSESSTLSEESDFQSKGDQDTCYKEESVNTKDEL